jgi:hypothetical protein
MPARPGSSWLPAEDEGHFADASVVADQGVGGARSAPMSDAAIASRPSQALTTRFGIARRPAAKSGVADLHDQLDTHK